jgi:predicted PurR-regulated permease PerM
VRNPFKSGEQAGALAGESTYVTLAPGAIESAFVAPKWLRDVGFTSWFVVGFALLIAAMVALLAATATITIPVILAAVIAAVASPLVSWQQRHGIPRAVGTMLLLLLIVVLAGSVAYAVLAGITSQASEASNLMSQAATEISDWLAGHEVDPSAAASAQSGVESSTRDAFKTLTGGIGNVISGLTGAVFFFAMTLISLIFLLKDGPLIRGWAEQHMSVPEPAARIVTGRLIGSLRGYFLGVSIIALFNALVVGVGAFVLGVPLIATVMLVTFICAYVPFIGAWAAGAFSVLIAFGADNESAVIGMIVVQLLANGMLQQIVQPIAYGAALGIHPLAALIATIGAGCLFGSIGLILGAPLLSAAVRISVDLANVRAAAPT